MDIIGGIGALLFTIPWIGTERSSSSYYKNTRFAIESFIRERLFKRAFAIVTNSKNAAIEWRVLLPKRVKVIHIPNAVDASEIERQVIRSGYVSLESRPLILVVGRLIQSKGLDIVIKAFKNLALTHDFKALIIGDGPLKDVLRELVGNFDLNDRVNLMSYNDEWWHYMSSASMLISMSRVEGQPNVVLESMMGGCPLIVSDIPSHCEILNAKSALMVPVDDVDRLSECIKSIIASPAEAYERAINAKRDSRIYNVSHMADSYTRVYQLATNFKLKNSKCACQK